MAGARDKRRQRTGEMDRGDEGVVVALTVVRQVGEGADQREGRAADGDEERPEVVTAERDEPFANLDLYRLGVVVLPARFAELRPREDAAEVLPVVECDVARSVDRFEVKLGFSQDGGRGHAVRC